MRRTLSRIGWGVIGSLFLVTPLFASSAFEEEASSNPTALNWAYHHEAAGVLAEIHGLSTRLADETDFLELNSRRNQLTWESHAQQLNEIRWHINRMGEKLDRLQEISGMIAPWQQKAVERVMPKAMALAERTEGAIAFLNEQQGNMWSDPYTTHVSAMSDHAEEIKSTVSMFLEYGEASGKIEVLESQIEYSGV